MGNQLKISLVICTYNRDKYLPEALESIRMQDAPKDLFELIIIDNTSSDNTAPIAQAFIKNNPDLQANYFFEKNKGLSFARNRGIAEAAAPVIAYVDDDAILSPGYIQHLASFFDAHADAVGCGGKVIPKYESGHPPVWMNHFLYGFVGNHDFGENIAVYDKKMKYPPGCNMAYKKEILQEAGGFNNDLKFRSDDKYIFHKVKEYSNKIYYVPAAWLFHYIDADRLSFENFKKLFLKTGNEEKIRSRSEGGNLAVIKKGFEFMFKFCASLLIYGIFILKGNAIKGRYVALSQWYTLQGFFKKEVFVR